MTSISTTERDLTPKGSAQWYVPRVPPLPRRICGEACLSRVNCAWCYVEKSLLPNRPPRVQKTKPACVIHNNPWCIRLTMSIWVFTRARNLATNLYRGKSGVQEGCTEPFESWWCYNTDAQPAVSPEALFSWLDRQIQYTYKPVAKNHTPRVLLVYTIM